MATNRFSKLVFATLMLIVLLAAACAPAATATPAATEQPAVEQPAATEAPVEAATAEPVVPAGPQVGGTFVWAIAYDPPTLDPHLTVGHIEAKAEDLLGAGLVYRDAEGNYTPWLAESWETSEDSLTWTFHLRQDVKFHNGEPLTAQDYAWTFNRMIAPETASPIAAQMVMGLVSAEAVDDYTLQLNFGMPNANLLFNFASGPGLMQPLPQAAFEEMGADAFGHAPIGVGPYTLTEFTTGDKFVLQRNPDYAWGPAALANSGPYYIETIEFRIIPEMSTILAGIEAGEIDYTWVNPKDMALLQGLPNIQFFQNLEKGTGMQLAMNVSQAPFDDVNVRKAFNMIINRQALIDLIAVGYGQVLYGPLTPATDGYWAGVEDIGYTLDPAGAEEAMLAAGYTRNADGKWLTPTGDLFAIKLITNPADTWTQMSEVIQSQLVDFGVDVTLESQEYAIYKQMQLNGEYQLSLFSWPYDNATILATNSTMMAGVMNYTQVNDPDMDMYGGALLTVLDKATWDGAAVAAQQLMVDKAYTVPLYATYEIYSYNTRIQGITYNATTKAPDLSSAYIEP
jgi:peptide/nickel transport system substrate-binding protein